MKPFVVLRENLSKWKPVVASIGEVLAEVGAALLVLGSALVLPGVVFGGLAYAIALGWRLGSGQ